MTIKTVNSVGEVIANTNKWSDKPLYEDNNTRKDIGYDKPQLPWKDEVMKKQDREYRQPLESPLKECRKILELAFTC